MARLKLATYNINGIRARLSALLEWLEREKPDIVCLQELKAPDEAFPQSDLERLGYGAIWHGQKSWNGVAILARGTTPEERRRGLPGGSGDTHSRYLEANVHGLVVGALYLPNGNPWPGPKFDYKLAWFERLIRHARKLLDSGDPVVLAGDFNVVPSDELDIYDPRSWRKDALLQPESREAWFRLLEQGWTDSLRTVAGEAKVFTFWDYFRRHWERDAGLRIDHVLLSPALAGMLADAGVDRWVRGRPGASDHAPTWVMLDTDGVAPAKPRRRAAKQGAKTTAATGKATTKRAPVGKAAPRRAAAGATAARAGGDGAGSASPRPGAARKPAKRPAVRTVPTAAKKVRSDSASKGNARKAAKKTAASRGGGTARSAARKTPRRSGGAKRTK